MESCETKEDESPTTTNNNSHEISQTNSQSEKEDHDISSSTIDERLPEFSLVSENIYLGDKKKRVNKEIRRMSCDCTYSADEHNFSGCGEDCLNRLLLIECNSRCPCGEFCANRKFQDGQKVKVEAFKTLKKGWGLRTLEDISANQFVIEYCGEVMGYEEFESRVETYDKENRRHYYFMTLRADEIIDATHKGNLSRFINHSCSPNCETQKWTVNGYLRIGFFSIQDIKAGTELTFDYKFQRYGKKAQVCYCESPNCRGIIGGEKHTPLKSIISGRAASPAPTSSPRRNRRRRLAEQYDDKPLELEIAQLLAGGKGIKGDEEALKLSQFMVRAETQTQRLLLLDTLSSTEDQNCLRSFVRYQGLSLLWSWMVDLGENFQHLQKKIVQVLKHLPVANLNQVKDTKVLKVINKWARKPSVTGIPEEETSSSDMDSQRLSPLELMDEAAKREAAISSSSSDTDYNSTVEVSDTSKPKDIEAPNLTAISEPVMADNKRAEETEDKISKDSDSVFDEEKDGGIKIDPPMPCGTSLTSDVRAIGDSSEEDSRWSEDECTSTDSEDITDLAADLLHSWRHLKEVYRIPKKSTIVEKREPESTSGTVEAVVTEPSPISEVEKIPTIPTIDGDLFQEDEFLSKLGEREIVLPKTDQQEPPVVTTANLSEIPPLMSSALTSQQPGDIGNDGSKPSIHQRLQMVAGGNNGAKQYPIWGGKLGNKSRKRPYNMSAGVFQPRPENWTARNQIATAARFNQPNGHPSNQAVYPGVNPQRPNMAGAQWSAQQGASPYATGYQYPPGGDPRASGLVGQNLDQAQQSSMQSYYSQTGGQSIPVINAGHYQAPYASHNIEQSYGAGPRQLPTQVGGVPTNMHNYQEMQQQKQSGNQPLYSMPPFDPSKPPPNFVPTPSNIPQQQLAAQTDYSNNPAQYPNAPSMYATTTTVPDVPGYPLQAAQTQAVSQTTSSSVPSQGFGNQHLATAVSTAAMVSSTVSETETLDLTPLVGNTDPWSSADQYGKPREPVLPPDWRKAYDAEGRAYYYHVGTRQTQWEPPTADRSPPTPELGYLGDELDSNMDMSTTFPSQMTQDVSMEIVLPVQKKKPKTPSTPPGSPPKSPVLKSTTAAADTTDVRKGLYSPSLLLQARHLTTEQVKQREAFRVKLSSVVVNYLNPYHKVDCKVGRITTVDDFKFLARKLTHGIMVKELSRLKDESVLACNDSVKIKTKEYIRNYMQKFGPVYKASV